MSDTVCIVDDEPETLKVMIGVLEYQGYQVTLAKTGVEALNVVQAEPPDVVLLDMWLPEPDGLEVLKRVREQFSNVAFIMMSGRGSVETAVKAKKLGAYDYLEKPLDLKKVSILVRNAIRESSISKYRDLIMENERKRQEMRRTVRQAKLDAIQKGEDASQRRIDDGYKQIIPGFLDILESSVREKLNQRSDGSEWVVNNNSLRENPFKKNNSFSFGKQSWGEQYGVGLGLKKYLTKKYGVALRLEEYVAEGYGAGLGLELEKYVAETFRAWTVGVWKEKNAPHWDRLRQTLHDAFRNRDATMDEWWVWNISLPQPNDFSSKLLKFLHTYTSPRHACQELMKVINVAAPIIDEHVRRTS